MEKVKVYHKALNLAFRSSHQHEAWSCVPNLDAKWRIGCLPWKQPQLRISLNRAHRIRTFCPITTIGMPHLMPGQRTATSAVRHCPGSHPMDSRAKFASGRCTKDVPPKPLPIANGQHLRVLARTSLKTMMGTSSCRISGWRVIFRWQQRVPCARKRVAPYSGESHHPGWFMILS